MNEEIVFGIGKSTVGKRRRDGLRSAQIQTQLKEIVARTGNAISNLDRHANRSNYTITGVIICQKAVDYARRLNIDGFSASKESNKLLFSKKDILYAFTCNNYYL